MSALSLIIQREYASRVKKKSFILITVFMPLIIVGLVVGTLFLSQIKDTDMKKIVVIDSTGKYASHLKNFDYYKFEISTENVDDAKKKPGEDTFGTIVISGDLVEKPQSVAFYSEKQPASDLMMYMSRVFAGVVKSEKLDKLTQDGKIDKEAILAVQQITESSDNIQISTIRLDEKGGEKEMSSDLASAIGMMSTMLMYIFIITYGAMVMQGVIEEKSNRIVEVMISSVKPFDLMMGKVIGIFLVGITQLAIWIVSCLVLYQIVVYTFVPQLQGGEILTMLSMLPSVNWFEIIFFFLLFFIGGYLMYASLFAMFGSAVDNAQDSQQFMMPITFIFIFALYAGIYSIQNPNGPLAFWCSMIPLTSPVVMMVRVPFGIPLWEEITSIGILFITSILVVKMAAKVYRVGILMYGKKPNISELIKWMRYK